MNRHLAGSFFKSETVFVQKESSSFSVEQAEKVVPFALICSNTALTNKHLLCMLKICLVIEVPHDQTRTGNPGMDS